MFDKRNMTITRRCGGQCGLAGRAWRPHRAAARTASPAKPAAMFGGYGRAEERGSACILHRRPPGHLHRNTTSHPPHAFTLHTYRKWRCCCTLAA